jgi:hypothetical protein
MYECFVLHKSKIESELRSINLRPFLPNSQVFIPYDQNSQSTDCRSKQEEGNEEFLLETNSP